MAVQYSGPPACCCSGTALAFCPPGVPGACDAPACTALLLDCAPCGCACGTDGLCPDGQLLSAAGGPADQADKEGCAARAGDEELCLDAAPSGGRGGGAGIASLGAAGFGGPGSLGGGGGGGLAASTGNTGLPGEAGGLGGGGGGGGAFGTRAGDEALETAPGGLGGGGGAGLGAARDAGCAGSGGATGDKSSASGSSAGSSPPRSVCKGSRCPHSSPSLCVKSSEQNIRGRQYLVFNSADIAMKHAPDGNLRPLAELLLYQGCICRSQAEARRHILFSAPPSTVSSISEALMQAIPSPPGNSPRLRTSTA